MLLLFLQTVDVTQQWSLQCRELEKQIEDLTCQLGAYQQYGGGGGVRTYNTTNCVTGISRKDRPLLKARDSTSDDESEETVPSSNAKGKLEFGE